MCIPHPSQSFQGVAADLLGIFDQALVPQILDRCQNCRTCDGVLLLGVMAQGSIGGHVQSLARNQGGQREYPTAQPLPDDEHVRDDAIMLADAVFTSPDQPVDCPAPAMQAGRISQPSDELKPRRMLAPTTMESPVPTHHSCPEPVGKKAANKLANVAKKTVAENKVRQLGVVVPTNDLAGASASLR